jgi:hypothetical protein
MIIVADQHHAYADADPDPACHFDADPDQNPTFHFDADPIWSLASKQRFKTLTKCSNRLAFNTFWLFIWNFARIRIRIQLFTLLRIRILPFNLMRIRIRIHNIGYDAGFPLPRCRACCTMARSRRELS